MSKSNPKTPRARDMEMIEQWFSCLIIMAGILPLIRVMVESERVAPGYGALATVARWTMMQAELGRQ